MTIAKCDKKNAGKSVFCFFSKYVNMDIERSVFPSHIQRKNPYYKIMKNSWSWKTRENSWFCDFTNFSTYILLIAWFCIFLQTVCCVDFRLTRWIFWYPYRHIDPVQSVLYYCLCVQGVLSYCIYVQSFCFTVYVYRLSCITVYVYRVQSCITVYVYRVSCIIVYVYRVSYNTVQDVLWYCIYIYTVLQDTL